MQDTAVGALVAAVGPAEAAALCRRLASRPAASALAGGKAGLVATIGGFAVTAGCAAEIAAGAVVARAAVANWTASTATGTAALKRRLGDRRAGPGGWQAHGRDSSHQGQQSKRISKHQRFSQGHCSNSWLKRHRRKRMRQQRSRQRWAQVSRPACIHLLAGVPLIGASGAADRAAVDSPGIAQWVMPGGYSVGDLGGGVSGDSWRQS